MGSSRAAAELLLGSLLARSGSASRARDLLLDGAARCEASYRPAAARLLAAAVIPALRAGSPARACEIGQRALEVAEGGPIEAAAALMLGTALTFNGDLRNGRALLLRAIELREQLNAEPQLRAYLGAGLRLAGEHDRARELLAQLIANARSHGAFGLLPYALVRLADVELDTGHWPAAHAALAEASSLAREMGQGADLGLASGALAWLDAAQGRAVDCRRHASEAIALAVRLGAGSRLNRSVPALGLLALGRGELDAAIEHLAEVRKTQLEQGWCDAAVLPHRARDLIEALVRAGRAADAERELSIFEQECRKTERPSALAALACCRGLLASPDAVDGLFRELAGPRKRRGRPLRARPNAPCLRPSAPGSRPSRRGRGTPRGRVHRLRPARGGALARAGPQRARGVRCYPSRLAGGSAERPGRAGAPSGARPRARRDSGGSRRAPAADRADGQTPVGSEASAQFLTILWTVDDVHQAHR